MWTIFSNIGKYVSRYSTIFGQFWYLFTFVFRLVVVAVLGSSVYNDEKGSFTCVTNLPACSDQCYNTFARITHMRFWSFQLLVVTFPAVLFQFYSNYITGEVEKLKIEQNELREAEEARRNNNSITPNDNLKERKKEKRMKRLGKIKMKQFYNEGNMQEVPVTRKLKVAYYISVVMRCVLELIFVHFGVVLYDYKDKNCIANPGAFNCPYEGFFSFMWMTVPTQFTCDHPTVHGACAQHFTQNIVGIKTGQIICYIARPFEKSIFLRYMQILAVLCFVLCIFELIYIPLRGSWRYTRKQGKKKAQAKRSQLEPINDDVLKMRTYLPANEITLLNDDFRPVKNNYYHRNPTPTKIGLENQAAADASQHTMVRTNRSSFSDDDSSRYSDKNGKTHRKSSRNRVYKEKSNEQQQRGNDYY